MYVICMLTVFSHLLIKSIPIWWRWYYWACPVTWTIYGLVASQFGDKTSVMTTEGGKDVKTFLDDFFVVGGIVTFCIYFRRCIQGLQLPCGSL